MTKKHRLVVSKEHVHKKLIFRLRKFAVIFTIMTSMMIYDMFQGAIGVPLAIAGIAIGLIIGVITGYFSNIIWHPETGKVIAQIDNAGIIILVAYILFSISRRWLFGHWIHGQALTAFCFSTASGVMSGRFLSTRFHIKDILKKQGHIPK